ncbi:hypothetical protein R1flu_021860 [Riccia fluitans]|uniref:Uncharacterized protein n=1 Tax=Riccia fluitans TaxID=41844 RepID=A0ABD1ZQK5_9MARC
MEAKSGMHGDALAATLPPLVKRSPVEAKAGYSWGSPSQGFASTGKSFANGDEVRKRCDALAATSPPLAKLSPEGGEGRRFNAKL